MRPHIRALVCELVKSGTLTGNVVEIGAFQVPSQVGFADMRGFFSEGYIGVDMRAGPGVDVVENVLTYRPEERVQTVLCLETLEHVDNIFGAVNAMRDMLTDDGVLLMTSHQNFDTHAHPNDYWRFTEFGFEYLLRSFGTVVVGKVGTPLNPHTVVGLAWKGSGVSGVEVASAAMQRAGVSTRRAK